MSAITLRYAMLLCYCLFFMLRLYAILIRRYAGYGAAMLLMFFAAAMPRRDSRMPDATRY